MTQPNPYQDPQYLAYLAAQAAAQPSIPQTNFQQPNFQQPAQAAPLAQGTLDDFYNQRTASGAGLNTIFKQVGTTVTVQVTRDLNNADVQQMTDFQTKLPKFYKDGRPMYQLVIPVKLGQPTPEFPSGEATWYVKGKVKDELLRAMGAANAGTTVPQGGAILTITYTRDVPQRGGLSPAKEFSITYVPPQGAQAAPQLPVEQPQATFEPPAQNPQFQATAQPPAPVAQTPQPFAQATGPVQNVPGMPAGLTPEQQAQFAKLTGQS
jgi:hypothetical protein